jgi:hypothetical protein
MQLPNNTARLTKVALAVASALAFSSSAVADPPIPFLGLKLPIVVHGTVGGAYFAPPVFADTPEGSAGSATEPSVYRGAKVCLDLNDNGVCARDE